jgi:hypothetical protein
VKDIFLLISSLQIFFIFPSGELSVTSVGVLITLFQGLLREYNIKSKTTRIIKRILLNLSFFLTSSTHQDSAILSQIFFLRVL